MDEIALIVIAEIERQTEADPAVLATAIIELWEAGYEIRPRPDMIPILLNPGHAD